MKKKYLLLPLMLTTLLYTGCTPNTYPKSIQTDTQPSPPRTPPISNFSFQKIKTLQGATLNVGTSHTGFLFPDFKKKIVLLEVFGKNCHFCLEELPSIAYLYSQYYQNLQVVALQVHDQMNKEEANNLIQKFNIDYPIIDRENGIDLMYKLKNSYEWNGILPFILLIKNGVTQEVFQGETEAKEIERAIKELL